MDQKHRQNQRPEGDESPDPDATPGVIPENKEDGSNTESLHKNEPPYVKEGWFKGRWKAFMDAGIDRLTELFLAFAITFFAAAQWITSCQNNASTTRQTGQLIRAANINACAAQKIASASERNAEAAESFSATSGLINGGIGDAVKKLKSQADATKEALYISQRAYVDIFAPTLDIAKKSIFLPITNTGHVPSGEIIVEVHQALYDTPRPGMHPDGYAVEWAWRRHRLDGIPNGSPVQMLVPFKSMDRNKLIAGTEEVLAAGTITYADGFPRTRKASKDFCFRSVNNVTAEFITLAPCDAVAILPILKRLDGYPQNEQQQP